MQSVMYNVPRLGVVVAWAVSLCVVSLVVRRFTDESITTTSSARKGFVAAPQYIRRLESEDFNFESLKTSLSSLLSLIYRRYELDGEHGGQFFNAANNIGASAWEIIKYKFATKMLSKEPLESQFLMVFTGSSVTAGHDNFYNQSYPLIFKARMDNIFRLAGIELIVHNIAQGANDCVPYVFCYETMGGIDPDFINWEQSYNCGHNEDVFEAAARTAGRSKHKGSIVYYSASGAWAPTECEEAEEKVPYCAEEWTPEVAGITAWEPSLNDLNDVKQTIIRFHEARASAHRFSSAFARDYPGVPIHGFNVWEENNQCNYINPKNNQPGHCNGIDAAAHCAMKFMRKEAALYGSDNGKGASWHPTRAFHMLRGEAIAWLYSLILMETVHMVESDAKAGKSSDAMLSAYQTKLNSLTNKALPNPKKCSGLHCQLRPQCFTDYKPHYTDNSTSLTAQVVGQHNWQYDAQNPSEWSLHYGYLDFKPFYHAQGSVSGEMHLKVNIGETKFAWICGNVKESLLHMAVYLDSGLVDNDNLKQNYTPSDNRVKWEKINTVNGVCRELHDLPKGTNVISISTDEAMPSHVTSVTHLITWP